MPFKTSTIKNLWKCRLNSCSKSFRVDQHSFFLFNIHNSIHTKKTPWAGVWLNFVIILNNLPWEDFSYQDTKWPDISLKTSSDSFDNFWSHIVGSATFSVCFLVFFLFWGELFCEAKIYQLAVASLINHNVFRFQISKDNIATMKMF